MVVYFRVKDDSMNTNPLRKDVIIIGGGIAGLTAAMYASMMALDGIVIQKSPYVGQISETIQRKNYPGLRNVTGEQLSKNIEEQVKNDFSVDIKREEVVDIVMNSSGVPYRFLVKTDYGSYLSKCIIFATGSRPRELDIGNTSLKGITYYPLYDAHEFQGKHVVIAGLRDSSVQFIPWLIPLAKSISLICGQSDCSASPMTMHELDTMVTHHKNEITVFKNHEVSSMNGNGHLQEVILRNIDDDTHVNVQANAMIVCSERIPNSELASKLGCDLATDGFVRVTRDQKTEVTGIFAAGDVTGVILTAIKSAGEGCVAGMKAAEYIKTGIW